MNSKFHKYLISGLLTAVVLLSAYIASDSLGMYETTPTESGSWRNRLAKWAAGWVIDRAISEPPIERPAFFAGPPSQDPSHLVRAIGDDGQPMIDNSRGW